MESNKLPSPLIDKLQLRDRFSNREIEFSSGILREYILSEEELTTLLQSELDKAREEGIAQGREEGAFKVEIADDKEYFRLAGIQSERTRTLQIIEEMKQEPRKPDPEVYITDIAWNQALSELSNKLNAKDAELGKE